MNCIPVVKEKNSMYCNSPVHFNLCKLHCCSDFFFGLRYIFLQRMSVKYSLIGTTAFKYFKYTY